MENLIISYIIKASLAMILLYGLYILCFRNDTFNKGKRFYLLFILLFSVLYPICKFNMPGIDNAGIYQAILPEIIISGNAADANNTPFIIGLIEMLFILFISGIVVLSLRLFIQLWGVVSLKRKNESLDLFNYKIISLENIASPFSFFNWIFIPENTLNEEDMNVMIAHEAEHAKQYHSIDILLGELFCILFWWNPIAWLLKKEIQLNLEYLADKGVLEKGIEAKKYQYLLLQVVKPRTNISIVNNFNVSQLKKRITMINKKRTSGLMSCKYLLALPIVALMLLGNAQNTFSQQKEQVKAGVESLSVHSPKSEEPLAPFIQVEVMPEYPGGVNAMMQYIAMNLKYPVEAIDKNIEGRVVIRFVVSKVGEVKDVTVVRSLDPSCDKEAVRVVQGMPKWTPGKQNGKDVDVYYTLPIAYKLQGRSNTPTVPDSTSTQGTALPEVVSVGYKVNGK